MRERERTKQQAHEIAFWQGLLAQHGAGYYAFRTGELEDKTKHFMCWPPEGIGIDVGCGCVSVFEGAGLSLLCVDPLMHEYMEIMPVRLIERLRLGYQSTLDGLMPGTYDYAVCINVIDHAEDAEGLVRQLWDLLKPGSLLYFEVNFDDVLGGPHYALWNHELVDEMFRHWTLLGSELERVEEHRQSRYWATYWRQG